MRSNSEAVNNWCFFDKIQPFTLSSIYPFVFPLFFSHSSTSNTSTRCFFQNSYILNWCHCNNIQSLVLTSAYPFVSLILLLTQLYIHVIIIYSYAS